MIKIINYIRMHFLVLILGLHGILAILMTGTALKWYSILGYVAFFSLGFNYLRLGSYILFIIWSFISISYLPQVILYGDVSSGMIASLFETNANEALEYLKEIPLYIYIIAICYLYFSCY
ncbi:hypothetical protein JO83_10620, partial [Avibacterium paragallinarum]